MVRLNAHFKSLKTYIISMIMSLIFASVIFSISGCDISDRNIDPSSINKDNIKIGFVLLGEASDQGYNKNLIDCFNKSKTKFGLCDSQVLMKTNIKEDSSCEVALKELASEGCNIIYCCSFEYEDYMLKVAYQFPNIQFCHTTGFKAAKDELANTHDFYPQIFQARYLSGIAAGLKTRTNKIGYVAAMPFSEVISGYTAFYLGAKSVNPNCDMDVAYTNTWNDANLEGQAAKSLIDAGCDVLGQHCDSASCATVAETFGAYQIGYHTDMTSKAPRASMFSCICDWSKYFDYSINCMLNHQPIDQDWTDGVKNDAVYLSTYNDDIVSQDIKDKISEAKEKLISGELHVFNTNNFTIDGEFQSSYEKNGYDKDFISNGVFHEQEIGFGGSCPAWPSSWIIDGIKASDS